MSEQSHSRQRRLQVLRAVVEDYVNSREPVGSKALVERHGLQVSAATIRNDMAALEDEGLITAPHTSAGRVPTEKGYRFFVDRIEEVKPLSSAEKRAIKSLLEGTDDLDEVLARTVRVLSHLTHQVAVIQIPRLDDARVRHVELVALGSGQVLAVLIATSGSVQQRVIAVPLGSVELELARVKELVLGLIVGKHLADVPTLLAALSGLVPAEQLPLATAVSGAVADLSRLDRSHRMVMAGTANLARAQQDFHGNITPVLEALEEQVVLLRLLSELEQDAYGVAVSIGSENVDSPLVGASVVASGYGPGNQSMIGVLGPTRMDYPGSIAAVRAIARYLSRILSA
ncbi:heat-inducible transcriptional repressor HrcA [Galactobacter caseinivorans]|uniref:Heat-inducible transcription repressor HrcA n=1 Tax=Galactobacter caseinivorans TaxID=2676123 RepID=A0A496PL11_9MICC|nr:heat-inducible transcriptional repressor HrcA [Galactobacter caseinivorans]RKW71161.1 heat-inducible transcriptional repressor HrcA [Galactobacter caseinivorans]